MESFDVVVVGGGAAGFFSAISAPQGAKVAILEKSGKVLSKVRISGGGRCNVTHACFDPKLLSTFYPRGSRELIGPFTRFQPKDTIAWFQKEGVALKEEEDGRMFPVTDSSETIIDCLMNAIKKKGVELKLLVSIDSITKHESGFLIKTSKGDLFAANVVLATGSAKEGHVFAEALGHTIVSLVPSLFTFNVPSSPLLELSGISVPEVIVTIEGTDLVEKGPLLLTHFGFSGPAVLRLSAWGAKILNEMNYQATLVVDWTNGMQPRELREHILQGKKTRGSEILFLDALVKLPKNLAKKLNPHPKRYAELSSKDIEELIVRLTQDRFAVEGKTTYKSEFVTCGGVKLSEVNFKTMESKICPNLFFAGEILDIDGITGGFNFQNAWTTGFIAGTSINSL